MKFVLISCGVLLLAQILLETHIETAGHSISLIVQQARTPVLDAVFIVLGKATSFAVLAVSGTVYLAIDRESGLLGLLAGCFSSVVGGVLKNLLNQPRAYWQFADVQAVTCPTGFGAPSGHSIRVGSVCFVLGKSWADHGHQVLKWVVVGLFLFILGLDRVYLGAHFAFQVVLGLGLASFIAAVLCCDWTVGALRTMKRERKRLLWVNGAMLMLYVLATGVVLGKDVHMEPLWEENYLAACGKEYDWGTNVLGSLVKAPLALMAGGMLTGYSLLEEKLGSFSLKRLLWAIALMGALSIYLVNIEEVVTEALSPVLGSVFLGVSRSLAGFTNTYVFPLMLSKLEQPGEDFYEPLLNDPRLKRVQ